MATAAATSTATPNAPTSTGDATPASVGDGTPQPPPNQPLGFVYNPTDPDIIELLRCKIDNVKVICDRVNKVDLYKAPPNEIITRLYPYDVDGNPHYLAFTKTKVIKEKSYLEGISGKLRRKRNVGKRGGNLMGYWRPHGERSFITDRTRKVVGSKLHFTYDDGHLRKTDTGMQRSVWNMIEYQLVSKTRNANHLKYTICKLYRDFASRHCKAFQEREAARKLARKIRNEILTLEHRGGEWYHQDTKDLLQAELDNCLAIASTFHEFEQELVDKIR